MSFRNNQTGFSAVALVLILLVVGAIAFAGYTVYNRQQDGGAGSEQSATASDVPTPPEIKSVEDLDAASATLDSVNLDDDSDESQLDSELNRF